MAGIKKRIPIPLSYFSIHTLTTLYNANGVIRMVPAGSDSESFPDPR